MKTRTSKKQDAQVLAWVKAIVEEATGAGDGVGVSASDRRAFVDRLDKVATAIVDGKRAIHGSTRALRARKILEAAGETRGFVLLVKKGSRSSYVDGRGGFSSAIDGAELFTNRDGASRKAIALRRKHFGATITLVETSRVGIVDRKTRKSKLARTNPVCLCGHALDEHEIVGKHCGCHGAIRCKCRKFELPWDPRPNAPAAFAMKERV